MFCGAILRNSWISNREYDVSGNSKLSFHVGAYVLNITFI